MIAATTPYRAPAPTPVPPEPDPGPFQPEPVTPDSPEIPSPPLPSYEDPPPVVPVASGAARSASRGRVACGLPLAESARAVA